VETFRVFLFRLSPASVSIVATLRFGGPKAGDEERRSEHETILHYPPGAPHTTLERLVALLDCYHPGWRQLITLAPVTRG
jgi:hypothetical protein